MLETSETSSGITADQKSDINDKLIGCNEHMAAFYIGHWGVLHFAGIHWCWVKNLIIFTLHYYCALHYYLQYKSKWKFAGNTRMHSQLLGWKIAEQQVGLKFSGCVFDAHNHLGFCPMNKLKKEILKNNNRKLQINGYKTWCSCLVISIMEGWLFFSKQWLF